VQKEREEAGNHKKASPPARCAVFLMHSAHRNRKANAAGSARYERRALLHNSVGYDNWLCREDGAANT
jgi:hypothetical protein